MHVCTCSCLCMPCVSAVPEEGIRFLVPGDTVHFEGSAVEMESELSLLEEQYKLSVAEPTLQPNGSFGYPSKNKADVWNSEATFSKF